MADIDKVKILVVGDSGVGKTSLTHLIAHNEVMASPAWTVGCAVEVKLHEFREGYPQQRTFFVELWDVGGSSSHRNTRPIFYSGVHGVLLVHDLTNRKSQTNLNKWLAEILNHEAGNKNKTCNDELDGEMLLGASNVPLLVIGTKADQAGPRRTGGLTFAEEVGCEEVTVDCRQTRCLAAGSSAAVKLSRFFDRAVEKKLSGKGKVASQCSHAALSCYKEAMTSHPELVTSWELQGQPKVVLRAPAPGESSLTGLARAAARHGTTAVIVRDAGRTQVSSGTATVIGIGPGSCEVIDSLTKSFRLY